MLINMTGYPNLKDLRLSHNGITDEGAKQLTYKCALDGLEKLKIQDNLLGPEGTLFCTQVYAFRELRILNLSKN
jgi:Ran GTPase-activating protein (RanGAP) involved in mRNA processing and transport